MGKYKYTRVSRYTKKVGEKKIKVRAHIRKIRR